MTTAVVGLARVGAAIVGTSGYSVPNAVLREIELTAVLEPQPGGMPAYWGSPIWQIDRGSAEFIGPIDVTLTVDGTPLPVFNDLSLQFAVALKGARPVTGDWVLPYPNPSGNGQIGVFIPASTTYQQWGIWVRYVDNPETIVLPPTSVGWVTQT